MAKVNNMKSQQVAFCAANDKTKKTHQEIPLSVQDIEASAKRHVDFKVKIVAVERDHARWVGLTMPKMHQELREEFEKRLAPD
jgi:hypothetical protein